MKIYAIIDLKAKVPAAIFTSANDESAERSFLQLLAGTQTVYADFPADFAVFPVGDLSVEGLTLRVTAPVSKVMLKNGITVGSFTVNDAVKLGSDYDRAYLSSLRELINPFPVSSESNEEV